MDKFYRIPIPIDHTATTKPRRKTKRKGKARGMVMAYFYLLKYRTGPWYVSSLSLAWATAAMMRDSSIKYGCQVSEVRRIRLPAPAGKGGGT